MMQQHKLQWHFKPSFIELLCLLFGAMLVFWYSWIMDDAYVYFRYVDNLVIHGWGLVWNKGEYVEGFSSPLWSIVLASLRVLHLDYWVIVRGLALLCFVLFWYMACIINRGFLALDHHGKSTSYNLPVIYLSLSYSVLCYFSSGLESPLVNVMAMFYAASVLWPQSLLFQVLVGLSPLVRQELIIPFFIFVSWCLFFKKIKPYAAIISFILCVGGYGVFRVWYFADIFPNTFYLKNTIWVTQGLLYLYDTVMPNFTIFYFLIAVVAYKLLDRKGADNLFPLERLMMIIIGLSVALYVVKIGGDARHFRYLAFPYIIVVMATGGLLEKCIDKYVKNKRHVVKVLMLFGLWVAACYPNQLQYHPIVRDYFGINNKQIFLINDAAGHRLHSSGITPPLFAWTSDLSYANAAQRFAEGVQILASDPTKPQVTYLGWCQKAYLKPTAMVIHAMGLTEPFLARMPVPMDRPAHKFGLKPLAGELTVLRKEYGFGRGVFDKAIAQGKAPKWISSNIDGFRHIENKVYNEHVFKENLRNALTRMDGLVLPE